MWVVHANGAHPSAVIPSPDFSMPGFPLPATLPVLQVLNSAQQLAQEHSHQQLTPIHVGIVLFEDPEGVARAAIAKQAGADSLNSALRMLRKALVRLPAVQTGDESGDVYISPELKKALQAAQKLQKKKGDSFLGGQGRAEDWAGLRMIGAGMGMVGLDGQAGHPGHEADQLAISSAVVSSKVMPCASQNSQQHAYPSAESAVRACVPPAAAAAAAGADVLFLAILDCKDVAGALSEAGINKAQLASAVEEGRGSMHVDSATADTQFDALSKYGIDLTARAAELDPVIGRDEEIRCVWCISCPSRCMRVGVGFRGGKGKPVADAWCVLRQQQLCLDFLAHPALPC